MLCSISVDLDEIPNYFLLYGLDPPTGPGARAVYDIALDRLDTWAGAHGIALTCFAVGSDLKWPSNAERLRRLAERGHEVGNHTLDHAYDLTRRSKEEMKRQVAGGIAAIRRATGVAPTGFRAPGYTMTDTLYDVLDELEVGYDSSVFPCPPYYAAKALSLATIFARGRSSKSILDRPSVLRAPTRPYHVGRPYYRKGGGILELPIQVTRWLRLPFIGTTLTLAGPSRARALTQLVVGEPFINLELHGIDVLDVDDGFDELRGRQPDAAVPHSRKLETLSAVVELLRSKGYAFVQLAEAAREWQ